MDKFISLMVVGCAAMLALAGCAPPEPVRIGFLGGLSGRVADLGIGGRNGAILAIEQRNARGGIDGRPVELLVEDDQQDPEVARRAFASLAARKVIAIVGPMTSAMAVAAVPLANEAKLPMVSPTVTTNELNGLDDQFFRVLASTRYYAGRSAEQHRQKQGLQRVAAIYDTRNRAYTESWLKDYRTAFEAGGGSVVATTGFASSDGVHFAELARQVLGAQPDGILILANSVDAAAICQQIRKVDARIAIGASEWAATERLIELGGKAVEGIVIAQFVDRQSTRGEYVEFRRAYRERFAQEPGFPGVTGFDATNVVLDSLAARAPEQTLKQAILARRAFAGLQSEIRFDDFGDTRRETYLTTVKDGAFVLLR